MSHISQGLIDKPTPTEIEHLEGCRPCRSRVVTDLNLEALRERVLMHAAADSLPAIEPFRSSTPWMIAAGAAVVVMLAFLPLLFLDNQPIEDLGDDRLPAPNLPPSIENDPPEPPAPPPGWQTSFEMVFEGENGVIGRLIWAGEAFYEGLRATSTENGSVFDYSFYREESYGYNSQELDPFPKDEDGHPAMGALPVDPAIPWSILLKRMTPDEMWSNVAGALSPTDSEPTHELAADAYESGDTRLEWAVDGIPVLVRSPTIGEWQAIAVTWREIRAGEVGNNVDLPFEYALYLAETTTEYQAAVLADGIVTLDDYGQAIAAAAECAGVGFTFDQQTGMHYLDPGVQVESCRQQFVNDIEEVWRVDSQFLDPDEFTIIWAIVEGRPDLAALHEAKPGPETALASGNGWAISIWERGPGLCYRAGTGLSDSGSITAAAAFVEGCLTTELFSVPEILHADVATSHDDDGPMISGSIVGLVNEDVDRVVINFERGETVELVPGETVHLGLRGFGLAHLDGRQHGEPTTIEVFAGDVSLGVYSHTLGRALSD